MRGIYLFMVPADTGLGYKVHGITSFLLGEFPIDVIDLWYSRLPSI